MRLAVVATHPVQYYAPLFRTLAQRVDLRVFYGHDPTPEQQGRGFDTAFSWDVDITSGYDHVFLPNRAARPDVSSQFGIDTPSIGTELDAFGCDCVLVLGWYVRSLRQAIRAARRRGIPVIVRGDSTPDLASQPLKRAVKSWTYPALLRLFAAAAFVGQRNRDFYRQYRYPEGRLFHSPHAVDTARFEAAATARAAADFRQAHGLDPDEQLILFSGKLVDYKRPLVAVEAAARLIGRGRKVRLVVAGSGPLDAQVRDKASSLDLPLTMLGFVNQTGMPAVYAAADVLVLPSTGRETWGLVVNEAYACGTPAVVSRDAGCAPDMCDGKAGFACDGADAGAVADALARALAAGPDTKAIARLSSAHGLNQAAEGVVAAAEYAMATLRWGRG